MSYLVYEIMKCSVCSALIWMDIMPRMHFDDWTDLKCFYQGSRNSRNLLVLCSRCLTPLVVQEQELLGHYSLLDTAGIEEGSGGAHLKKLGIKDYISLLDAGAGSKRKERYLRCMLWWKDNDARRNPKSKASPKLYTREISNMSALADLFNESYPEQLIMKAEILRELGRFEEALLVLNKPANMRRFMKSHNKQYSPVLERIKALIEEGDTFVRPLQHYLGRRCSCGDKFQEILNNSLLDYEQMDREIERLPKCHCHYSFVF